MTVLAEGWDKRIILSKKVGSLYTYPGLFVQAGKQSRNHQKITITSRDTVPLVPVKMFYTSFSGSMLEI